MSKKAAIYDPYLDTLGGGERYCLTVAETLLASGYDVDIFWSKNKDIISKAESRFNLNISKLNIVDDIFNQSPSRIEFAQDKENINNIVSQIVPSKNILEKINTFIRKYKITREYDLIFYISDWSIPFLFSKNNLLHVQVPFSKKTSISQVLLNKIKLLFINHIICNSNFTKKFAINQFGAKSSVLYPPVDVEKFYSNKPKENIILTVGRFDNILNSKKQDFLIESFIKLSKQNKVGSWKMILAGASLDHPDQNLYLQYLKTLSDGYPIEFVVNPDFNQLKSVYQKSSIYWHAAGFDVDELVHPENTEHFGMAPVEAMAAGLVPVVVNQGGLNEIIDNDIDGYLWDNQNELISKTQLLIASPTHLQKMAEAAVVKSNQFSKQNFINNLTKYLSI